MVFLVFWYHVASLVFCAASFVADLLVLSGRNRVRRVPLLLVKGALTAWILNYAVFYFQYAFFPGTPPGAIALLSILSLAASCVLLAGLSLFVHEVAMPSTVAGDGSWSRTYTVLTSVTAAFFLVGMLSTIFVWPLFRIVFLHIFYLVLCTIAAYGFFVSIKIAGLSRHERFTLRVFAVAFPLVWLDHLVINVPLPVMSGQAVAAMADNPMQVTEGILVTGFLALVLSIHDLRFLRSVLGGTGRDTTGLHGIADLLSGSFVKEYRLTGREVDVGTLIAKGLSGNEIAEALFISRKTAEAHTYNIYRKCGVKRRTAFIALLNEYGIQKSGSA